MCKNSWRHYNPCLDGTLVNFFRHRDHREKKRYSVDHEKVVMLNAVKHLYPARKAPRRELRFFAEFILSEAEGLRMTFREVLIFSKISVDSVARQRVKL
jgi:hypothetical protein